MIEDAIPTFERLGYDANEARFLALAAVHSGYFVRRQFTYFLGQERGGNAHRFIEKLLGRGHASYERYPFNKFIYHIRSKKIYNRLGQCDNRNRREKAPLTIKRKLMCLDFVLANPTAHFLETESEKVRYFTAERQVPIHDLPVRRYRSHNTGTVTERYFVDKLPIYIDGSPSSPVVHFAFIDEGAESLQGFGTFLSQYTALFSKLQQIEVIYVAASAVWFAKSKALFDKIGGRSGSPVLTPEELDLLDFFRVRSKYEARDFTGLDTERLIRFREEKRRYSDAYEQLYRRWLVEGDRCFSARSQSSEEYAAFRTMLITHDYDILGGVRRAS